MASEDFPFTLTLGGLALGILILILGVMQNNGQALNGLMVVGGVVAAAGVGVYVLWLDKLETT